MPAKGQKQSEEAKFKISLAKKGKTYPHMSKNGWKKGNLPWNTGLKMAKEYCKNLSVAHLGKKQPHKGVPRTEETKKKISNYWKTHKKVLSLETRKKQSNNMIYKMKMRIIPNKDTKIELLMRDELERRKLIYTSQFKYELGIADFLLFYNNKKIIIECNGMYWHSKPQVAKRDVLKVTYLLNNGYDVYSFTDKEILSDVKTCVDEVVGPLC